MDWNFFFYHLLKKKNHLIRFLEKFQFCHDVSLKLRFIGWDCNFKLRSQKDTAVSIFGPLYIFCNGTKLIKITINTNRYTRWNPHKGETMCQKKKGLFLRNDHKTVNKLETNLLQKVLEKSTPPPSNLSSILNFGNQTSISNDIEWCTNGYTFIPVSI